MESDIKYGAYKTLGTSTHYRYKDLLYIWNVQIKKYYTSKGEKSSAKEVNEYYTTAPTNDHVLHDSSATAYKWFTSESTKVYYMKMVLKHLVQHLLRVILITKAEQLLQCIKQEI